MATQFVKSQVNETSICNQALSWVGVGRISDLNGNSAQAEWCRDNFPFIRDAVLEECLWSFATVRAVSESTEIDPWGNMYIHRMPLNWLEVKRVYNNVQASDPRNWIKSEGWRKEQDGILSSDAEVYMWGVERVTDTAKWSNMFVQALASRLAAEMAIPLAQDRALQSDHWSIYSTKIDAAAANDGLQNARERIKKGRMTTSRGTRRAI